MFFKPLNTGKPRLHNLQCDAGGNHIAEEAE